MTATFSQGINHVSDFLDSALVGPHYKARILRYLSLFPAEFNARIFGFECPLRHQSSWADFHIEVNLTPHALEHISQFLLHPSWDRSWQKLVCFLEKWAKEEAPRIVLEFDIGSSNAWPSSPNLFLMMDGKGAQFIEKMEEIFCSLKNIELSKNRLELLRQLKAKKQEIFGVGLMLARSSSDVRVCIQSNDFLNIYEIDLYLKTLGFCPLNPTFSRLLQKVAPHLRRISLELDIGDTLSSQIGANCFIKKGSFRETQKEWESLLKVLLAEGLVEANKIPSLLNWRGGQRKTFLDLSFEEMLANRQPLQHTIIREISHVKLVQQMDGSIKAKTYLMVTQE